MTETLATTGTSSGARLAEVLEATGLSAHAFAGYWAGYPLGAKIPRGEDSDRGRRFRTVRRSLFRWLADVQTVGSEKAVEIVTVANRLLVEQGKEPFAVDYLVTAAETRGAALAEIGRKLDEVLDRLARIEEML